MTLDQHLSHRYMKQFGNGLSCLEAIMLQNAYYMLGKFDSHVGRPLDTMLKATGLRPMSVPILGRALDTGDD